MHQCFGVKGLKKKTPKQWSKLSVVIFLGRYATIIKVKAEGECIYADHDHSVKFDFGSHKKLNSFAKVLVFEL